MVSPERCEESSPTIHFRSHIDNWVHSSVLAWVSFKVGLGLFFFQKLPKKSVSTFKILSFAPYFVSNLCTELQDRCKCNIVETWLPATPSLSLSITDLLLLSHIECYVPKGQGLVKLLSCTALVLRPVFCMITVWNGSKTKKQTGLQFHLKVVDPMGPTSMVENALIIHQVHRGVPCKFW